MKHRRTTHTRSQDELSKALRRYAQAPGWNDMSRPQKSLYVALKTCLVTFLVTLGIVSCLYCVWVLALVYGS